MVRAMTFLGFGGVMCICVYVFVCVLCRLSTTGKRQDETRLPYTSIRLALPKRYHLTEVSWGRRSMFPFSTNSQKDENHRKWIQIWVMVEMYLFAYKSFGMVTHSSPLPPAWNAWPSRKAIVFILFFWMASWYSRYRILHDYIRSRATL